MYRYNHKTGWIYIGTLGKKRRDQDFSSWSWDSEHSEEGRRGERAKKKQPELEQHNKLNKNQEKVESDKTKGHMFPGRRNDQMCWMPLRWRLGWEPKVTAIFAHLKMIPFMGKLKPVLGIENKLRIFLQWMETKN